MPRTMRRTPPAVTPTYTTRPVGRDDFSAPSESASDDAPSATTINQRRSPSSARRIKERRTSSGDSTGSFMSVASTPGYRLRPVSISDEDLVALAHETKRKVHWDAILRAQDGDPAKWKWQEYIGDFSIFVREDAHRFAVLAIGTVPGSVAEIVSIMHAKDNDGYLRKMEALYGDSFRDGCFVYNVDIEHERTQELSRHTANPDDQCQLVGLSVKTATFQKPSWLAKHEEWCYLDAIYQEPAAPGSPPGNDSFEKLMTSIRPHDIIAGLSASKTKYIESVVSGYLLKPEVDTDAQGEDNNEDESRTSAADPCKPKSTRVHFYAELSKTTNQHHFGGLYMPSFGTTATDKSVKNRLIKMARSSARLPLIVQRRRLGVQNVIDLRRIFPPTNTRCAECEKFLLVAKMCRLCGQGVCQSCSSKHYRETQDRATHRVHVHHIRVCDACITRVERSNYSYLTHTSLAAPRIRRDPEGAKRASEILRSLLLQAYQSADSDEKRASVLAVMRAVIGQDNSRASSLPRSSNSSGTVVTVGITNRDFLSALEYVHVDTIDPDNAELAHTEGRGYVIDSRKPMEHINHPLPANEAQRLQAIEDEHLRELGNIPELNIVCDLAAEEIGCFATMVTVIDRELQLILGANLPFLREARFPRADTFCSHIIMDSKPLVVPHPEADIRFGHCGPVQNFGARYYCGFPLLADDGTVLGSLCCVDTKTHELTASQYTTLQKLAQTATKVVRTATQRFDRDQLQRQLLEAAGLVDTNLTKPSIAPNHAAQAAS